MIIDVKDEWLVHDELGLCCELIPEKGIPRANLINILAAAFFKPACALIFLEAYFDSYKQFKCLIFLLTAQKQLQAVRN